jgi:hypothetical protein
MIKELFISTMKRNFVLLVIFYGVLLMYLWVLASMFDPDSIEEIMAMLDLFPEDMIKGFGFSAVVTDITGYFASWLYGMLMLGFPMVYCIILGNRLCAKMVDNGSFVYLLSTPNSRVRIIVTQGVYAILSVFVLFGAVFLSGVAICAVSFPGELDVYQFFRVNAITANANVLAIMISFFFSCVFNDAKMSTAFGAGVPIAFLLMNMLGGASEKAEILKKLSIYGIYDPVEVVKGAPILPQNIFYIAASLTLLIAGTAIFNKKRLPI